MHSNWEVGSNEVAVVVESADRADSPTWIAFYLFVTTLWTLFLVSVPVITEVGPDNYYADHPGWYTGNDVMRFIEPVGGLMLNFLIFYKSGIMKPKMTRNEVACVTAFIFAASLYVQGAGFHSAAITFKNSLERVADDQYDDNEYGPLHFYMRTVWEHGASHYIYAAGYALMQAAQLYAYREVRYPEGSVTVFTKALLAGSGTLLGLLLLGVALQFPSGTIVGFIYLVLYGLFTVGGYHFYLYVYKGERKVLTDFGHLLVLHHFLLGYVLSFCALVLWLIVVGGFKSRSHE